MYTVFSIHSGHAGNAGIIDDFYRQGVATRGLKKLPLTWYYPASYATTSTVSIKAEGGGLVAQLRDISLLQRDNAHLWIAHEVFACSDSEFAPSYLDITVDGVHQYWKRLSLRADDGVDIWADDPAFWSSVTAGVIYQRTGRTEEEDTRPLRVSIAARTSVADEAPNAYLNPLVLRFPVDGSLPETRADLDYRSDGSLLDIHPGLGRGEFARLALHAAMRQGWAESLRLADAMPAVPRLLFGEGCPAGAAAMFPLLDALGGAFFLDNAAGGGEAAWRWHSTPEVRSHTDLLWLARHCTSLLGIELTDELSHQTPLPVLVDEVSRHRRNETTDGVTRNDLTGEHLEEALARADVPRLVRSLAARRGPGEEIRRRAAAAASETGFPHFSFVEEVGRDLLLPRSPILATLPTPPPWLDKKDMQAWEAFRERNSFGLLSSPVAAASWWFKLLDPKASKPLKPLPTWEVEGGAWWWSYYAALFRRPYGFAPRWEQPAGSGELGEAVLGGLVLGGRGRALTGNVASVLKVRLLAEGRE